MDKVSNSIKKLFVSKPLCNEKYFETTLTSYEGKINTNFLDSVLPEDVSRCICLSVTLIDSVFNIGANYYPQVFLEQCEYIVKKK